MSTYQQTQQPVTPVVGSGCIEPTRVNIHDIDECLVPNKCECSKQDSKHLSNQWLSNTFSLITSGSWGKSKIKKGKEVTKILIQTVKQSWYLSRSLTSSFNSSFYIVDLRSSRHRSLLQWDQRDIAAENKVTYF